eukprot:GHVU01217788.1.p2 GENE.GHVU01217788.1~~GHVU01217788.1.p2  ORF type:complete len:168 (-),score=16.59 GHVU01217788.1:349-852(-)
MAGEGEESLLSVSALGGESQSESELKSAEEDGNVPALIAHDVGDAPVAASSSVDPPPASSIPGGRPGDNDDDSSFEIIIRGIRVPGEVTENEREAFVDLLLNPTPELREQYPHLVVVSSPSGFFVRNDPVHVPPMESLPGAVMEGRGYSPPGHASSEPTVRPPPPLL